MKKFLIVLVSFLSSLIIKAETSIKIGDKAPDFSITDPNGKSVNLYSLQGKIIILDFWASWCGPCRLSNKDLIKLYKDYKVHNVEIFSVSLDSKKDNWIKAIEKDKLDWPLHGCDFKEWDSPSAQLYSISALPTTFLIDEEGNIVAKSHYLPQIELSLKELIFKNSSPFPKNTSSVIHLSEKLKYEILDKENKSYLKGKGDIVDVSLLPAGDYLLQLEHQLFHFKKIPVKKTIAEIDSVRNFIRTKEPALLEIYTQRGKIVKETIADSLNFSELNHGIYFFNFNGVINRFEKKKTSH